MSLKKPNSRICNSQGFQGDGDEKRGL